MARTHTQASHPYMMHTYTRIYTRTHRAHKAHAGLIQASHPYMMHTYTYTGTHSHVHTHAHTHAQTGHTRTHTGHTQGSHRLPILTCCTHTTHTGHTHTPQCCPRVAAGGAAPRLPLQQQPAWRPWGPSILSVQANTHTHIHTTVSSMQHTGKRGAEHREPFP